MAIEEKTALQLREIVRAEMQRHDVHGSPHVEYSATDGWNVVVYNDDGRRADQIEVQLKGIVANLRQRYALKRPKRRKP